MSVIKHTALLADVIAMHNSGLNVLAIASALDLNKIQAQKLLKEAIEQETEDD